MDNDYPCGLTCNFDFSRYFKGLTLVCFYFIRIATKNKTMLSWHLSRANTIKNTRETRIGWVQQKPTFTMRHASPSHHNRGIPCECWGTHYRVRCGLILAIPTLSVFQLIPQELRAASGCFQPISPLFQLQFRVCFVYATIVFKFGVSIAHITKSMYTVWYAQNSVFQRFLYAICSQFKRTKHPADPPAIFWLALKKHKFENTFNTTRCKTQQSLTNHQIELSMSPVKAKTVLSANRLYSEIGPKYRLDGYTLN